MSDPSCPYGTDTELSQLIQLRDGIERDLEIVRQQIELLLNQSNPE
jgi:hypothetical protein